MVMFVYRVSGITITISLPVVSIVLPNNIYTRRHFGVEPNEILKILKNLKMIGIDHNDVRHDWVHPPESSERYKQIYTFKLLGLLSCVSYDTTHYHFLVKAPNALDSILKFLEFVASQTEKGHTLYLSQCDLNDLKWRYQEYQKLYTLEHFSETISAHAINCSAAHTTMTPGDSDYLKALAQLRRFVEKNISAQTPHVHELKTSLRHINSNYPDKFLKVVNERGEALFTALAEHKPGIATWECEDLKGAKRKDFRLLNNHIALSFLTFYTLFNLICNFRENTSIQLPFKLLISYTAFNILGFAEQEPRHLVNNVKRPFLKFFKPAQPSVTMSDDDNNYQLRYSPV
jgi:hypothetical protein